VPWISAGAAGYHVRVLPRYAAHNWCGHKYTAEFKEAAGLKAGNEVRIAGVKVGQVTDVRLGASLVLVDFRTKDAWVGNDTTASIQIKTLWGRNSSRSTRAAPRWPALVHVFRCRAHTLRTDVVDAFSDAARSLEEVDTGQLAQSMQVLSQTFSGTPPQGERRWMGWRGYRRAAAKSALQLQNRGRQQPLKLGVAIRQHLCGCWPPRTASSAPGPAWQRVR